MLEVGSDKESLMPGEKTTMRLQATAGSLCSIAMVDKSVHLLAGNNHLSLAKVLLSRPLTFTLYLCIYYHALALWVI